MIGGQAVRQTVLANGLGCHERISCRWGRVLCWLKRRAWSLVDRLMAKYV